MGPPPSAAGFVCTRVAVARSHGERHARKGITGTGRQQEQALVRTRASSRCRFARNRTPRPGCRPSRDARCVPPQPRGPCLQRTRRGQPLPSGLEQEESERRKRQPQRLFVTVRRNRLGEHDTAVSEVAAAVHLTVAVHQLEVGRKWSTTIEVGINHTGSSARSRNRCIGRSKGQHECDLRSCCH